MRSLSRINATTVTLTWTSVSNAIYRVQYISDLSATNWTDVAGDVLANSNTASKPDLFTSTNRFYRINVLP